MATAGIRLQPLETTGGLKEHVYSALRKAITSMDIYSGNKPPKLDERSLAENLGVSRTPTFNFTSRSSR